MKPVPIIIALIVLVSLAMIVSFLPQARDAANATPTPNPTTMTTDPTPLATYADASTASQIVLKTTMGDMTIDLFPADAPLTVKNFVTLGKHGYYDGVIFHRIIKGFMNQTGDPLGTGTGGSSIFGDTFKDEQTSRSVTPGTLAMANRGSNTNGSQFFIEVGPSTPGSGYYTVFGQLHDDASTKVAQAINAVATNASDKPLTDVKITGFTISQP